jgi:DNA-binding MarR family transcriptional regulator
MVALRPDMPEDEPGHIPSRGELITQAVEAIVSFQDATDAMDEAAAAYLGATPSEIRCLGALQRGPLSAGELAERLSLTRGAITALVDRLEARGFLSRQHVAGDRRRVHIALTPLAIAEATRIYGPLAAEGAAHFGRYTGEQLAAIADFLSLGRDLQLRHAARVRAMTARLAEPGDETGTPRPPEVTAG